MDRQSTLSEAFVALADTMVDDFDVIEFLHELCTRCTDVFAVDAAGILLIDKAGTLRVMAASSEESRLIELFQVQIDQGPCLDCYRTGRPIAVHDATQLASSWPRFAERATQNNFVSVYAIPMRFRNETIGGLNLFSRTEHALDPQDLTNAQALADIATIGLLNERSYREAQILTEQLQTALNSRIVLEQAKGMIAQQQNINMEAAFHVIRTYSRREALRLHDIATAITNGELDLT